MRTATFVFLISSISIGAVNQSFADPNVCSGQLKQPHPHPYGSFNFETYSLHDMASKLPYASLSPSSKYKYGTVSCVTNPDPANFLYVHWLIPGPDRSEERRVGK